MQVALGAAHTGANASLGPERTQGEPKCTANRGPSPLLPCGAAAPQTQAAPGATAEKRSSLTTAPGTETQLSARERDIWERSLGAPRPWGTGLGRNRSPLPKRHTFPNANWHRCAYLSCCTLSC